MNDRSEMERNRGGAFTTNAVNPRYPMFQLPGLHSAGMATAAAAAPPSTPSSSAAAKEDEFVSLDKSTMLIKYRVTHQVVVLLVLLTSQQKLRFIVRSI